MREFRSYGSVPRLQQNFGRTWPMTLKLSGTYSSISAPSSPNSRKAPPEPGQQRASRSPDASSRAPLYRQSEIYGRQGVDLDCSTLASWVGATSQLLDPLIGQIRDHVLSAAKIHADDTPISVLAPGHGRTRTGRLWTCVRDDRPAGIEMALAIWSAYSVDRRGEHPQQHSGHFQGTLQADVSKELTSWRPLFRTDPLG